MLTIGRRGSDHLQCFSAERRARRRSGERRKRAVQAVMSAGLERTEAYGVALAAELFEAAERSSRPRQRGER